MKKPYCLRAPTMIADLMERDYTATQIAEHIGGDVMMVERMWTQKAVKPDQDHYRSLVNLHEKATRIHPMIYHVAGWQPW